MKDNYNKKSVTKKDWQKWYAHKSNKEKWIENEEKEKEELLKTN